MRRSTCFSPRPIPRRWCSRSLRTSSTSRCWKSAPRTPTTWWLSPRPSSSAISSIWAPGRGATRARIRAPSSAGYTWPAREGAIPTARGAATSASWRCSTRNCGPWCCARRCACTTCRKRRTRRSPTPGASSARPKAGTSWSSCPKRASSGPSKSFSTISTPRTCWEPPASWSRCAGKSRPSWRRRRGAGGTAACAISAFPISTKRWPSTPAQQSSHRHRPRPRARPRP